MWWLLFLACTPDVPRALSRPNALAVGLDGELYVSDFGHDRIVVFDQEGEHLRSFGAPGLGHGQLWRVYALAVDHDGSLLVVNRRPDSAVRNQRDTWEIKRFVDGRETQVMPFDGHFPSTSHTMHALVVAPDGAMVVANPGGGQIFQLDRAGRFMGQTGGVPSPDAAPYALAWSGDDLWVAEQRTHRVYRVVPGGEELPFVVDDAGHGPLRFPTALGVCADQWVAIADLGNHRVQRYGLDGTWLGGFEPARAGPDQPVQLLGLAVTADCGRLVLADSKGDRVLITSVDGEVLHAIGSW